MSSSLEQELIAHARVLRGLARDLVGDSHADDLVQETALQALRSAPPRQQHLGGWLAGIVRHLASRHHRSERRRQRREQLSVLPEAQPAPTDAADRDAFAQLTAAVLALPQPYQATILARYVRDLTPSQIAARTGAPVATVKTRLARALGLLRERLAREGVGRDWRAALGAAFGLDVLQPAAFTTTTGVLLMGAGAKLGLGGLAAVLLAVAWWGGTGHAPETRPVVAVDPAAAAVAQDNVAGDAGDRTTPRREELADPTAAFATVVVLRGRCVDTEGKPLAGCAVRARGVPGSPARLAAWQRDHGAFSWTDPSPAATGDDGAFVLLVPPTGPLAAEFNASAPGRAPVTARWAQLEVGADVDLGDVVLRRQVRVRLHVVDASGEALPDVGLSFRLDDSAGEGAERRVGAITDAAGRAELALAEGEHSIAVSMLNASPESLRVPGNAAEFDVELQLLGLRGVEFLGGVVLQKNGLPVANAFVVGATADGRDFYWTRTAADGRFVFGRPDRFPDVPQFLRCTADGHDTYVSPEPVPFGERNVQIVLEPGLAAEFHVRDAATGAPVERFDLVLVRKEHRRYDRPSATGFHRGGIVCFDPLPRGSFDLSIVPQDEALCASYFQPVRLADPAPAVVEVRLARAATRQLVVRRADGSPVGGARFERIDNQIRDEQAHPDRNTEPLTLQGWLNSAGGNHALLHQVGSTDERGEATLRGPPDRLFAVRVTGAGNLPFVACDVSLAATGPLSLTVEEGARLRGTIGPASFLVTMREATRQPDPARLRENELLLQVELNRVVGADESDETVVPVAEDGTFAAEGLAAGMWRARFRGHCRDFILWHPLGEIALAGNEPVERNFDLADQTPAHVVGTAAVDGELVALATVRLGTGVTRTDPSGRFEVWTSPGRHTLFVLRQGDSADLPVAEDVAVGPGQVLERAFELRTGLLRVQFVDAQGRPVVAEVMIDNERRRWRMQRASNHEGRIEQRLETGTFQFSAWPRSLQKESARDRFAEQHPHDPEALQRQRVQLGSCTVAPDHGAWQVLVVPAAWDR